MIENKKMDLFDAPKGAILAHACNCQGVWGGGIAKVFRNKYPLDYAYYNEACIQKGRYLLGKTLILNQSDRLIGCLFTSYSIGENVDSIPQILHNTRLAILDLYEQASLLKISDIYSNKFNSGLFKVPWYKSEDILLEISCIYPEINWTVTTIDNK